MSETKAPAYSIVIPTYNHLEDCLKPCIESIIKNTDLSDVEIIIVANGCTDGTLEYLQTLRQTSFQGYYLKVVWINEAAGYTKATNAGIRAASGDYIILLNNDNEILGFQHKSEWITVLKTPFDLDKSVGITGVAKEYHIGTAHDFLLFFCVMLSKKVIEDVGLLDEAFNPGYGEDIDYCFRLRNKGYKVLQVPKDVHKTSPRNKYEIDFPLWHKSSITVHEVPGWEDIVSRNEKILRERYMSARSSPKYSIVIPTYNHLEDCLKPCIESIIKNTDLSNVEIIVVANGCTDGTREYVEGLGESFKLIWIDEAAGYPRATNAGIKASTGEYIVLLNNDTVLLDFSGKSEWLKQLAEPFKADAVGMSGPFLGDFGPHPFLLFFCVMIKKKLFEDIGLLDESFGQGGGEDTDFCIKAANKGYRLAQVPENKSGFFLDGNTAYGNFPIWHKNGATRIELAGFHDTMEANGKILTDRYISKDLVSIIIPTYNHLEDCLKPCIESIIKNTDLSNVEIIVVANGCTDGTKEYVLSLGKPFRLVWMDKVAGYVKATNAGIKNSWGQYIILLNNDTVILDFAGKNGWIDILKKPFENSKVGITGVLRSLDDILNIVYLPFFCVMIKKEVITKVGLLDEVFGYGYCEDIDYCERTRRAGFEIRQVPTELAIGEFSPNFPIWHKMNITFLDSPEFQDPDWDNAKTLIRRYTDSPELIEERLAIVDDQVKRQNAMFKKDRRIYDCFMFFNEFDLLEIRLNELDSVVYKFVLVEARFTHQGNPKPLYFDDNKARFSKWLDKIIHIVVDKFPETKEAWDRETFQREALAKGLTNCSDEDIVLISDVDEIFRKEAINRYRIEDGIMNLEQDLYYYYLNCKVPFKWFEAKITPYKELRTKTPHEIRHIHGKVNLPILQNAGWHFSYLGNKEYIVQKLESFSHTECNNALFKSANHITECMNNGKDLFGRFNLNFENINDSYPEYIKNNLSHFTAKGLIKEIQSIPTCSIVIPTCNHLEDCLKHCIESIIRNTNLSNFEVIIVANGCTDGTREYIEGLGKPFKLIWMDEAAGYIKPTNAGIRAAQGEYVVLLNNDVTILDYLPRDGWIEVLRRPFEHDQNAGISGPLRLEHSPTGIIYLHFCCVMIKKSVFDKVGLLDEEFGYGYSEDADFCERARQSGFTLCQVPYELPLYTEETQFPILHIPGRTFNDFPQFKPVDFSNEKLLVKKYAPKVFDASEKFSDKISEKAINEYRKRCSNDKTNTDDTSFDICEHLPTLKKYAEECQHITEFGVRTGNSTWAMFVGCPKTMRTYDKFHCPIVEKIQREASHSSIDFSFEEKDVLQIEIEPTDLLFVDTKHSYEQLSQELRLHASKVRKYIVMHDTAIFGKESQAGEDWQKDIVPGSKGLILAIEEFLKLHPEWRMKEVFKNCNGLTIIERITDRIVSMKYSIIIPTYNHLENCLKPCIESIIKNTDLSDVEVIVVANGCTDGTREYVEGLGKSFKLIWTDDAIGYPRATNAGIKAAKGEYIILLNNDAVLLDRTWIEVLNKPFTTDASVGLTGPGLEKFDRLGAKYLMFFCVMIGHKVFEKIGYLDETFDIGTNEDIDFCIRATLEGFTIVQTPVGELVAKDYGVDEKNQKADRKGTMLGNFPIYHKGGETVTAIPNFKAIAELNCNKLLNKYSHLNILNRYQKSCNDKTNDISGLLPILHQYAKECQHITELGVRSGNSTWAFLLSNPKKMISYDTNKYHEVFDIEKAAKLNGIDFTFVQKNVLETTIEPTDLLFIDTFHHYDQLVKELKLHGNKSNKYIIMHDTDWFGDYGQSPVTQCRDEKEVGLRPAIKWFLENDKNWKTKEHFTLCCGLTVLERVDNPTKYSIVIPTHNHLEDFLKPCIESIVNNTDLADVEVIIVANGCTDGTREYVEGLGKSFKLIWIDEAAGYIKPTNAGIRAAQGEYVVLLNNDVALLGQTRNEWLNMLERPFANQSVGITGPRKAWNEYVQSDYLTFFCVMIKREVFEKVGLLDEDFGIGYQEDIDFCMRAKHHGYSLVEVPTDVTYANDDQSLETRPYLFPISHYAGGTFWSLYKDKPEERLGKGNLRLIEKYSPQNNLKKPKFSIIVSTYKHLNDTLKPCIESVIRNTDLSNVEVIVVANDCTDGTREYIEGLGKPFRILCTGEIVNEGKAANMGIREAQGEFVVLLARESIIMGQNWIEILERPFTEKPDTGISGPMKDCHFIGKEYISFFCAMMRRSLFEKVGLLNERNYELDFGPRVTAAGYNLVSVPENVPMGFPIYFNPLFEKINNDHSFIALEKGSYISPFEIARYSWARKNMVGNKVLEIGCGVGYGSKFFSDVAELDYTGINRDKNVADFAQKEFGSNKISFVHADISTFNFEQYDTIISLEFSDNTELLEKLKKHCKKLLVSIPYDASKIEDQFLLNGFSREFMNDVSIENKPSDTSKQVSLLLTYTTPKYSIVIPTYNHLKDCLKPCIEAIVKNTDLADVEVIIVANGCTDGTREYVEGLGKPFRLIWIDEAAGYTRATNIGIREASGEYVILLNNDGIILDSAKNIWIEMLVKPFVESPLTGITGVAKEMHPNTMSDFLLFFCVMIRREMFEKLGLLDEVFNPGYGEDIDYCNRIKKAGYNIVQVPKDVHLTKPRELWDREIFFPISHVGNRTVNDVPGWNEIVDRNEKILKERYPIVQFNPKYSIVIPTYNHFEDCLKPCIESIIRNTNLSNVEVIVVANGCTDGTREYVEGLGKPFRLIWMKDRAGYIKPTNAGIGAARGEYVILLNNDVTILPSEKNQWIDILAKPFEDKSMGITGPEACWIDKTQWLSVIFWCAMIKKEVFERIGLLSEDFGEAMFEDVEFCARALIAGFKTERVPENMVYPFINPEQKMPIYHGGSATYRYQEDRDDMIRKNKKKLSEIIDVLRS